MRRRNPRKSVTIGLLIIAACMIITIALETEVHGAGLQLSGNNVTVMEGYHEINGSITVEENATLVLRNAIINFTSTHDYQFETRLVRAARGLMFRIGLPSRLRRLSLVRYSKTEILERPTSFPSRESHLSI